MARTKSVLTAVVGLLLIASLIGYSGEEIIEEVPIPDAGLCGVTKDSYNDVPGSGAVLDIDVDVSWDEDTVWIGIIDVDTFNSLEKIAENNDGHIVTKESCDNANYIVGGPNTGQGTAFEWEPDGEPFYIMIGSLEEVDEEDEDEDDPWPFTDKSNSMSFVGDFTVSVDYDASGGWGSILALFLVEILLVYVTFRDRS
tara:strand:- start:310 stop:903 length:594 start_codon:yes stop_codon:yes gene_type:complete